MEKKSKYCCPLTGKYFCIRQMLLFKEMNNILICDVNAKVTEKGVWCNPNRNDIEKAIKHKVFDKLLNKKLKINQRLVQALSNILFFSATCGWRHLVSYSLKPSLYLPRVSKTCDLFHCASIFLGSIKSAVLKQSKAASKFINECSTKPLLTWAATI